MSLAGRSAIVTGAARGIGYAIGRRLAREGMKVALADVDAEGVNAAVERIGAEGGEAVGEAVDVANPQQVEGFVEETAQRFGSLYALVNNAAIQVEKNCEDIEVEEWNRVIGVNLTGPFLCTKFALTKMREAGGGSIVNIASANSYYAEPNLVAYSAAKGGIVMLTKSVAMDFGRHGIRCNAICPGYIDTGLAQRYFDSQDDPDAARREAEALHAVGRMGSGDEVASMTAYLLSDEASFVTASALVVDGGWTAGIPAT